MRNDEPVYRGSLPRTTRELAIWHGSAPPEEAIEPELPIIDTHHHLYGTKGGDHHYSLDDLKRDVMGGHNIAATVYVEAFGNGWRTTGPDSLKPVGEVEMIVGLTQEPLRTRTGTCEAALGIVSHANLILGDDVVPVLEAQIEAGEGRLRGIRHQAAVDDDIVGQFLEPQPPRHMLSDPRFLRGFRQLRRFGLSFDALIFHPQLDELIQLADAFPDIQIVLNHIGAPVGVGRYRRIKSETREFWKQRIRALAERDNVTVKLGGLGIPPSGFDFEHREQPVGSVELAIAWGPLIETCIDAFGTDRCMFESNFPVDMQYCGFNTLWNAFKRATSTLSGDERRNLFSGTAQRVYRLSRESASGR